MKAWIDGEFVPLEQATVPILSHGFSRGSAVFEVVDVVAGPDGPALFRIDRHVDRLLGSAEAMGMSLGRSAPELIDAARGTVRAAGVAAGVLKVFAFYAAPELGLIPADPTVRVAMFCFDLRERYGVTVGGTFEPVTAGVSRRRRLSPGAFAIQAKVAGHYVNAFLAVREARQRGFDEAIMLDEAGMVAEAALSNLFVVIEGVARTPTLANSLSGVTRDSLLQAGRAAGLPVEEAPIPAADLARAEEAFLTGTVIRIRPLRALDGRELSPCPGPVTRRLQQALNDAYDGRNPAFRHWLTDV